MIFLRGALIINCLSGSIFIILMNNKIIIILLEVNKN